MKVTRSREKDVGEALIYFQKIKTKGAFTTTGNGKMMFLMGLVKRVCRTELIMGNGSTELQVAIVYKDLKTVTHIKECLEIIKEMDWAFTITC